MDIYFYEDYIGLNNHTLDSLMPCIHNIWIYEPPLETST